MSQDRHEIPLIAAEYDQKYVPRLPRGKVGQHRLANTIDDECMSSVHGINTLHASDIRKLGSVLLAISLKSHWGFLRIHILLYYSSGDLTQTVVSELN